MSDRSPLDEEQPTDRPDSDSITFVRDPLSGTARPIVSLAGPRADPRSATRARPAIEMKTIIGTPPAPGAVAIRHIRQVAEGDERAADRSVPPSVPTRQMPGQIPVPGALGSTMVGMPAQVPISRRITVPSPSPHGITTRELSAHELAHELEVARLLDQLTESAFETPVPSSSVERPSARPPRAQLGSQADAGSSLHVTQEMSLDELLPPSHVQLPALGQAARGQYRNVVHTDATPTVIADTSQLFPPATREALQAPDVEVPGARYEGPAPSVAPRPTPVERPKRSGLLIAGTVAAVLLLGLSVYAKRPNAPGVATMRRAVASLLGRADKPRRAPRPPAVAKLAAAPAVPAQLAGAPAAPSAPEAPAQAPVAAPEVAPAPSEAVLVQAAPAVPEAAATAQAPTGESAAEPAAQPVERTQEENDKQALFAQPQRAAELYVEGRFKEALAEYRMLATFHPEQRIYADFARILRRRLVETCIRTQPHRQTECNQL
jgi:hypothetical protein